MRKDLKKTESEKTLERKFKEKIEALGGFCTKNSAMGFTGMPDRNIYLPYKTYFLAEIKTTGKKPKKRQPFIIADLRRLGFTVFIIDSTETLNDAIAEMRQAITEKLNDRQSDI